MSCRLIVNARFLTQRLTGVQRFATEISLSLRRLLGDEVKFVSPKNILNSEIAKQLEVEIVGSHSGYFWEQIELPNYLKHQGNPPLLNLCNMAPILYKNSYVTVHDILWVKYPQLYSSLFTAVYNWLIPTLCRRAKKVFTVSNNSKYDLMAYTKMPASHFDVIYNAVSGDFSPVPDEDLRAENYFLAVSSMKANKNFPMVLASFKKLQATLPDVRLYIIGDLQDKNFNAVNLAEYIDNTKISLASLLSTLTPMFQRTSSVARWTSKSSSSVNMFKPRAGFFDVLVSKPLAKIKHLHLFPGSLSGATYKIIIQ